MLQVHEAFSDNKVKSCWYLLCAQTAVDYRPNCERSVLTDSASVQLCCVTVVQTAQITATNSRAVSSLFCTYHA